MSDRTCARDARANPQQIILYLENIWDMAEGDEEFFREDVRDTFLHELGPIWASTKTISPTAVSNNHGKRPLSHSFLHV